VKGMPKALRTFAVALQLALAMGLVAEAKDKRAITPADCVAVRDLQHDDSTWRSTIRISPDGRHVAYAVSSPNVKTNENEIELYVRKLPADPDNLGKPLAHGNISGVRWLADSRHLTFLVRESGRRRVEQVDYQSGERQVLVKADADISEYSTDQDGKTVVYATRVADQVDQVADEIAGGYLVPFQTSADVIWARERLFVVRRSNDGWSSPIPISITSPLSNKTLVELPYGGEDNLNPTLSPDGTKFLVRYMDFSEQMPDEWRQSGYMRERRNVAGVIQAFTLIVLYDLATGRTSLPLKSPFVYSAPLWSADSSSFIVVAQPPVGSDLERENVRTRGIGHSTGSHMFVVQLGNGTVEDVATNLPFPWEGALFRQESGDLYLRESSLDTIKRYSRIGDKWQQSASWHIPVEVRREIATDGRVVIGSFNDTMTPPQLFTYRLGDQQAQVFAKLNPQFDELTLAQAREVHWKTSSGFDATGLLLLPPDYREGVRYPLVIQTKPFATSFVCSFGNFPSFAPQPIANAGMMYLGQIPTKGSTQREDDYYPKGFPGHQGLGGIAEAAFAMDLWDSAVKALDEQGLIDRNRVGIIGFSRTGWYTEFILAHSKFHYAAATVADNAQYSVGEYWLNHDANTIKSFDQTYGGPPYGATLKNWLDYSVSFNLDKFHTPLLLEQMGYGRVYNNPAIPPVNVAVAFEVLTGLNRLNKPVELYYYPTEEHTPQHPKARLATMQRNVDWYQFWLQHYERPDAEDRQQYLRWNKLRELQREDEKNNLSERHGLP
jgi:hypothetical protein